MSIVLKSLYYGLTFRSKNSFLNRLHPLTIVLHFVFIAILVFIINIKTIVFIIFYLFLIILLAKIFREEISFFKGILIFLIIIGLVTYIFYGLYPALLIVLRLITSNMALSIILLTVDLDELASITNNLPYIGKILAMIPIVSNLIPLMTKDAIETINALYFRGELRGKIFKPTNLVKFTAVFIASVWWRSVYLAEALALKGFGEKKKVIFIEKKFGLKDVIFIMSMLLPFLVPILIGI